MKILKVKDEMTLDLSIKQQKNWYLELDFKK